MVTKTVKMPKALADALSRAAKARGLPESELIREGIERVTREDEGLDMLALIGGDFGLGHGPQDLSTNRQRLSGYGRTRHR
jgi:hypothetical protein